MRLPQVSGRECVRALLRAGFAVRRQRSSHITLTRDDPFAQVTVPAHDQVDRGTLRAIIRQVGLSVDEFTQLLK
ncbi:MAG: type II toxin-antitoxin system HicA family toxin [Armatimonadota bacterium]